MNKISWPISCESQETFDKIKKIAYEETDLDRIYTDIAISYPGGILRRETKDYYLGDNFNQIRINEETPTSFKISFYVKENAANFWKDLVVITLSKLRNAGAIVGRALKENG